MRKFMSFGIAAVLTAVAITAWAAAPPRSQTRAEVTYVAINPLVMMKNSSGLQVQQYDLF
jgi:hypothetical protein